MTRLDLGLSLAIGRGEGEGEPVSGPTGFVCDGDSITEGPEYLPVAPARPAILATLTGLPAINLGVSGRTLADIDSTFGSRGVADLYDPASTNTLILLGGSNDIGNTPGITLADLQASMTSYCGKAVAAGFRVAVGTVLPTTDFDAGKEALRGDFNAWLKASAVELGVVVVDYDAIPEAADPTDATYYADELHPTVRLLDLMALAEAAAVGADVAQLNPNPDAATGKGGWLTYSYSSGYDQKPGASVLSVVSGRFRLSCPDVENIYPEAEIPMGGFEIGETYRLSFDLVTNHATADPLWDASGTRMVVRAIPGEVVDTLPPPNYPPDPITTPGTITLEFVASAEVQTVYIQLYSETAGAYIDFDNVRVTPV